VRPLLQSRIDQNVPGAPVAREALIFGLMQSFRFDDASAMIDLWLEKEPDQPIALFLRGKRQEQDDRLSDALQSFRRVLAIDPEFDEARLRMTRTLLQLSQGSEAVEHLRFLRRRYPENPEILAQLGQALDLQGSAEEARDVLDECLRRAPDHPSALTERGRIARRDGDAEKAETLLQRAVQFDPGNLTARYQYYLHLNAIGRSEDAFKQQAAIDQLRADERAIDDLIRRQSADSRNPSVQYEIAMIAGRAGRPVEALRWLQKALRADPDYLPAHRALAGLYQESGNPVLANHHRAIAKQLGNRSKSLP
jgi:tetratricopeptide (TPR) repeat protein